VNLQPQGSNTAITNYSPRTHGRIQRCGCVSSPSHQLTMSPTPDELSLVWAYSVLKARLHVFSPWRWGGSSTQAWMPTYVYILRIPQMIWVLESDGGMIYWHDKTEELGEKPVPVPLCPPQIPYGLTRARTLASAVRGWRLTTWAMARPRLHVSTKSLWCLMDSSYDM
jgi:hypothetical protein